MQGDYHSIALHAGGISSGLLLGRERKERGGRTDLHLDAVSRGGAGVEAEVGAGQADCARAIAR